MFRQSSSVGKIMTHLPPLLRGKIPSCRDFCSPDLIVYIFMLRSTAHTAPRCQAENCGGDDSVEWGQGHNEEGICYGGFYQFTLSWSRSGCQFVARCGKGESYQPQIRGEAVARGRGFREWRRTGILPSWLPSFSGRNGAVYDASNFGRRSEAEARGVLLFQLSAE